MLNLISLLTLLLFCLGLPGTVLAQREVPPPSNNPLEAKPAAVPVKPATAAQGTKAASKPVQSATTQPEKGKKTALPAPVQASTVPSITEPASQPTVKPPTNKAKKIAAGETKKAAAKSQAQRCTTAAKPKEKKAAKVCPIPAQKEHQKVADKKDTAKVAKKQTQKRVIRATTVPSE